MMETVCNVNVGFVDVDAKAELRRGCVLRHNSTGLYVCCDGRAVVRGGVEISSNTDAGVYAYLGGRSADQFFLLEHADGDRRCP